MLEMDEIDMIVIGAPKNTHCPITVDAASAGKHVVEKPLAMNLAEADRMIEACKKANVKLMYAEELCFAPRSSTGMRSAASGASTFAGGVSGRIAGVPLLLRSSGTPTLD